MTKTKQIKLACISIFILCIAGCKSNHVDINCKLFKLKCQDCLLDTLNAYSGYIVSERDTIAYNLGFIVSPLSDAIPEIVYLPPNDNTIDTTSSVDNDKSIIVVRRKDYDNDRYRKQNIVFKNYNNKTVKYTFPIDTFQGGVVGVYYDSLKVTKYGILKFNAFSKNIRLGSYNKCKNIIDNLELYPFDSTHLSLPVGSLYVP